MGMIDEYGREEQEWERLRREVKENNAKQEPPPRQQIDTGFLESRFYNLEQRFNHIDVRIVAQMEALTAAYQHIAKSMDKLVTRSEFNPVRSVAYGIAAVVLIFLIFRGH